MIPYAEADQSPAPAVSLVNQYWKEAEEIGLPEPAQNVADRMGWTLSDLTQFSEKYRDLITYDRQLWDSGETVVQAAPSELQIMMSEDDGSPSPVQVALAIEKADSKLQKGLKKMGLSEEESEEWEALSQFNRDHFKESMDMVSANVARTSLRLSVEQKTIANRLAFVREQIRGSGGKPSPERRSWVDEENMLMTQYVEIGDLLRGMQDTWFRGAAQLALIRMRYGKGSAAGTAGPPTTKTGRPKFSEHPSPVLDSPP